MRLEQWHKTERAKLDAKVKRIADHARELADHLGVSPDDPEKMELLHNLAASSIGDDDVKSKGK